MAKLFELDADINVVMLWTWRAAIYDTVYI